MPSKPAKAEVVSQFGFLADELGALEKEMAPHAQQLARIEALKKSLRNACTANPLEQWTVTGSKFIAVLGPRANQQVVDFVKLAKAIGAATFAKFATCTLKDLEINVAPAVIATVVEPKPSGSRSLKTFEKGITT